MGFNLIYWTPLCGKYFLDGSILEKITAVFPGSYSRIGEIPHGQLRPDWGNAVGAAMARLGSKGIRRYYTPIHGLCDGYLGIPYPSY